MKREEIDDSLKKLIRQSEQRFIWYKKTLEEVYKDNVNFPKTTESDDYKNLLRELKNEEEKWLKVYKKNKYF